VVEQKLTQLVKEFQDGRHEGSVLTIATVESLAQDEKDTWRAIRKELEDIGISVAAFDANKDFIMRWFQEAFSTGAFDEQVESDTSDFHSDTSSLSSQIGHQPSLKKEVQDDNPRRSGQEHPNAMVPALKFKPTKTQAKMSTEKGTTLQSSSSKTQRQPRVVDLVAAFVARFRGYDNLFIEALATGQLVRASELLVKGANIHALYKGSKIRDVVRDWPAICVAVAVCYMPEIISWLLNKGADVQARNPDDDTLLHIAVRKPELEILDMLIARGAKINAMNGNDGLTPLCRAVVIDNGLTARSLLEHGADCNLQVRDGWTPLMFAAQGGLVSMVDLLIELGADINISNKNEETALIIGAQSENPEAPQVVQLLLNQGALVNFPGAEHRTALSYAVANGNIDTLRMLLQHGANPNGYHMNSDLRELEFALDRSRIEVAKLPIEKGADVNALGAFSKKPMLHIIFDRHFIGSLRQQMIKLMLEHGADLECVDSPWGTLLDKAVFDRDFDASEFLIAQGAKNNYDVHRLRFDAISEKVNSGYVWLNRTSCLEL
jgi:ankyrin repeat protein